MRPKGDSFNLMSKEETHPKYELPASIISRGQFTVTAGSPDRRTKVLKLMEKAGTGQLSTAAWKAIDFYLEHASKED